MKTDIGERDSSSNLQIDGSEEPDVKKTPFYPCYCNICGGPLEKEENATQCFYCDEYVHQNCTKRIRIRETGSVYYWCLFCIEHYGEGKIDVIDSGQDLQAGQMDLEGELEKVIEEADAKYGLQTIKEDTEVTEEIDKDADTHCEEQKRANRKRTFSCQEVCSDPTDVAPRMTHDKTKDGSISGGNKTGDETDGQLSGETGEWKSSGKGLPGSQH